MLIISGTPVMAISEEECTLLQQAHALFLESSFTVTREFKMIVNGDLKAHEIADLEYSPAGLITKVTSYESYSKLFKYENEGKDFVLKMSFECDRTESIGDQQFELRSEDGKEVVMFIVEDDFERLQPVSWHLNDSARALFKKYEINLKAVYSEFLWK